MQKKWSLAKRLDDDLITHLLLLRGLKSPEDVELFLNPPEPLELISNSLIANHLTDLDLSQLEKAVERIESALSRGEKITVWGDYDVDGLCSTAILWETLYGLGADVLPHIPDRFSEGYGLNTDIIKRLRSEGTTLLITVDTGITSKEEVKAANSLGMDVVIVDHHVIPDELPPAYAIVHTTALCGSGIAWLISERLVANSSTPEFLNSGNSSVNSRSSSFRGVETPGVGESLAASTPTEGKTPGVDTKEPQGLGNSVGGLDLAAIGTIADIQPLLGPNRSIVKHGLQALRETKRIGLLKLFEEAGIEQEKIDTYHVGWTIGPRLNAAGRVEHGLDSLRLLCTKDKIRAKKLSFFLGSINRRRQGLTTEAVDHALTIADRDSPCHVLYHPDWHEGIVGLVAGKIVEEFYRPALVITKCGSVCKGSGRSIEGFNIVEELRTLSHLFEDLGGHAAACGFTIKEENVERLRDEFIKIAEEKLPKDLAPVLKIDAELDLKEVNFELLEKLLNFQPFGLGNPQPVFSSKAEVLDFRTVGRDGKHLKLYLHPGIDAIGFGLGECVPKLVFGKEIEVAYNLEENIWNGNRNLQLKLRDLRL